MHIEVYGTLFSLDLIVHETQFSEYIFEFLIQLIDQDSFLFKLQCLQYVILIASFVRILTNWLVFNDFQWFSRLFPWIATKNEILQYLCYKGYNGIHL